MKTDLLPVIDCKGTPRERGRAHGEALRAVIADKVGRWREAIGVAYGVPAEQFLPRFLNETDFRAAIARHTPDLVEEVTGIAEGAGLAEETAYAMQLMDEEWWFGVSNGDGHCSSLAIAPQDGRPTLVGQTMDLPRWHDGAQALLRFAQDDGSETFIFTSAGMIGLMGIAGRGLGICVNTLAQLAVSRTGLPVAFVMRGALQRKNVADAAAFLASVNHASGQNYQLGDRDGAATVECSAGSAVALDMEAGRSLHTNHPLKSRDARDTAVSLDGSANSRARLDSLRADLSPEACDIADIAAVKTALSACRPNGEVAIAPGSGTSVVEQMTIGSVVYEIGETVSLSVCAGPPGVESWRIFTPRSA